MTREHSSLDHRVGILVVADPYHVDEKALAAAGAEVALASGTAGALPAGQDLASEDEDDDP